MIIKNSRRLLRLIRIHWVFVRYGLDRVVLSAPIFYPFRFLCLFNPFYWIPQERKRPRGERIRLALEALGPIFIKFGQLLSTRRDLLPIDIADELAKLQDHVAPFRYETVEKILLKAYGKPLHLVFRDFQKIPLASASIAQVHTAILQDGREAVVKVLRPKIRRIILRDVSLLYSIASLAERYWSHGKRLRPREVVAEFEHTILDELDFLREAANASQLRRNFLNSALLYIPEIFWDFTRDRVLVMERIQGVPISDLETLRQHQVDLKCLAERGVEIFFTQVFRDCFFHADMHPGNIFVSLADPKQPQYLAVDFGIIGTLSPIDQRYLAENFLAFFKRDYRRVAQLHVESGWVPPQTRVDEFESAIRTVCEPIFERPLKDISCAQLLIRLFQTAGRFQMEIQPQLVLLQKTLLNVEGLGRQLYPELDLWHTAKPFLEKWMHQQMGAKAFLRKIKENAPYWSTQLPDLPQLVYNLLEKRAVSPSQTPSHRLSSVSNVPQTLRWLTYLLLSMAGGISIATIYCSSFKMHVF